MSKLPVVSPKDLAELFEDLVLFWIARRALTPFIFAPLITAELSFRCTTVI
jgi:hypothetical protein